MVHCWSSTWVAGSVAGGREGLRSRFELGGFQQHALPPLIGRLEEQYEQALFLTTDMVVVDAIRSPSVRHNEAPSSVRPDILFLAMVPWALVAGTDLDPGRIDDVQADCGNQAGQDKREAALVAALLADFPVEVSGITVNHNDSSGLKVVNLAAKSILAGEGDVFVGSGVETMSRDPAA